MGWLRNYGSYLWDHRYGIADSVIAQPLVYDALTRTDNDLIKTITLAAYVPLKLMKLHSTFYAANRSSQGLDGTRRALQYLTILPREFSGFIASYSIEQVMSHSFVRDMLGSFGLRFLFETGERVASGAVTSSTQTFQFLLGELYSSAFRAAKGSVTYPLGSRIAKRINGHRK